MTDRTSDRKNNRQPGTPSIRGRRRYTAEIDHVGGSGQVGAAVELDENGFITSWSKEAEDLYGYYPEEILGSHMSSLYCNGELEQGRAAYELNAIATRRTYNVFGWQLRKSGQQFWTYTESKKTEAGFLLSVKETARVESDG
jgi:PAS domain S-box-containing protein